MTRSHPRPGGLIWVHRARRDGRSDGCGDGLLAARRWAAVSFVAALSLTACSLTTSPTVHTSGPGPSASTSPEAAPTAEAPAPTIVHVSLSPAANDAPASTDTILAVTSAPGGPPAGTTSDGDTGLIVEIPVTVAPGATVPLLRLTFDAGAGSTVVLAGDDTGAVTAPTGELLIGFTAPVVLDAAGTALPASWQTADDAAGQADGGPAGGGLTGGPTAADLVAVDLVADPSATAYPLTVSVHLGTTVVAGTEWGNREGGESLAVTPSTWGRASGQTGEAFGWADVVRLEPTADTPVMEKQFRCHQLGAPNKATWNLEPWRPDVSYLAYLTARCNPT